MTATGRSLLVTALIASAGLDAAHAEASLLGSIAFHSVAQGADYASTRYALAHGGREGNAFMVRDAEAKKILATFVLAGIDDELGRRSKKLQWGLRGGVALWVGRTVVHNIVGAQKGRR